MEQEHIDDILMDIQLQEEPTPIEEEIPAEEPTEDTSPETVAEQAKETEPMDEKEEEEPEAEPTEEAPKAAWLSFFTRKNIWMLAIGLAVILICTCTLTLRCYHITMNDQQWMRFSLSGNVERVVKNSGIEIKDNYVIEVEYPSPLSPIVTVHTDFDVTMQADGTTLTKRLAAGTDREGVLAAFGIVMDEDDRFSMAEDERLLKNCMVTVNRVEVKTETYEEAIACPVQDLTEPELGTQTLASPGKEGLRKSDRSHVVL